MKKRLSTLVLLALGFNAQAADLFTEQTINTEKFSAYVYPINGSAGGGLKCGDAIHSGFGDYPGYVSLFSPGKQPWQDGGVDDRGQRLTHISSFDMKLPKGTTCADVASKLPTQSGAFEFVRVLKGNLVNENGHTLISLHEEVSVTLAEGIVLVGDYSWRDGELPSNGVVNGTDMMTILLRYDELKEDLNMVIRPAMAGLTCRHAGSSDDKHDLVFAVSTYMRGNNVEVSRVFESKQECMDAMNDMMNEISVSQLDNQGFEVSAHRRLVNLTRARIGDQGGRKKELVRAELISFEFMGMQFDGSIAIRLWPLF